MGDSSRNPATWERYAWLAGVVFVLALLVESVVATGIGLTHQDSAATIAAGLHGIQKKLPAPRVYEGNAYEDPKLPQVPKTLREAIAELERSKVAREALGDDVLEHYLHTARLEQQTYDQVVTDWELMRGFERI